MNDVEIHRRAFVLQLQQARELLEISGEVAHSIKRHHASRDLEHLAEWSPGENISFYRNIQTSIASSDTWQITSDPMMIGYLVPCRGICDIAVTCVVTETEHA